MPQERKLQVLSEYKTALECISKYSKYNKLKMPIMKMFSYIRYIITDYTIWKRFSIYAI